MTVGALIKRLEKFDKEQIVRLHGKEGESVLFVLKEENKLDASCASQDEQLSLPFHLLAYSFLCINVL